MQILGTRPKDFYLGTGDAALTGQHSLEKDPRNHTCKTAEMLVSRWGRKGCIWQNRNTVQFRDVGSDALEQAGQESRNPAEVGLQVLTSCSEIKRKNNPMGKDT